MKDFSSFGSLELEAPSLKPRVFISLSIWLSMVTSSLSDEIESVLPKMN